jgi:hypothetical protein
MKTLITLVIVTLLSTGCALQSPQPDAVAMMPNDCANYSALNNFLTDRIEGANDETQKRYYKHRLWEYRYVCGSTNS